MEVKITSKQSGGTSETEALKVKRQLEEEDKNAITIISPFFFFFFIQYFPSSWVWVLFSIERKLLWYRLRHFLNIEITLKTANGNKISNSKLKNNLHEGKVLKSVFLDQI